LLPHLKTLAGTNSLRLWLVQHDKSFLSRDSQQFVKIPEIPHIRAKLGTVRGW
jgi:hypothetical protein